MYTTFVAVRVGVRELRAKLSHYLDRARAGEEIVITERGKPVARLSGPSRYDELVERGLIRPAPRPRRRLRAPKGPVLERPNLSDTVIEGRR
jgi:prevent-host-death family protein